MSKRLVIGIAGLARVGKDTAANAIVSDGNVQEKRSFAAPLKRAVNEIYGWNIRHSDGDLKESRLEAYASVSRINDVIFEHFGNKGFEKIDTASFDLAEEWLNICQHQGALVSRSGYPRTGGIYTFNLSPRQAYQWFGTDLMRNQVDPDIWLKLALAGDADIVIPDVRFENEAQAIRDAGGLLIHLRREGVQSVNAHVSEAGVQPKVGDIVLQNDSNEAELATAIRYLVARFKIDDLPELILTPTFYSVGELNGHYFSGQVYDSGLEIRA